MKWSQYKYITIEGRENADGSPKKKLSIVNERKHALVPCRTGRLLERINFEIPFPPIYGVHYQKVAHLSHLGCCHGNLIIENVTKNIPYCLTST